MGKIMKARGLQANFVQIPNTIVQSKLLSLKAKGLLCYLLSLPEDWVVYKTKLHTELKEGRDATIEAFNELIEHGYVLQVQIVGKGGRFEYDYVVYNEAVKPVSGKAVNGKTVTDNPYTVNPLPYKEDNNKEIIQTNKYTLTQSSRGELFETTLKAEKEKAPQVAPAPPIEPPDYYDLPNPLNQFQKAYNEWVKERELTHGKFKYVQQESQLIAFVKFCTRNNLNQSAFFEHCLLCATGGDWKNLNPELAKRSFSDPYNQSNGKQSGVSKNVENLLNYAERNP